MGDNKATAWLECSTVESADFYVFGFTETPVTVNSTWTQITNTKRKVLVITLNRSKEYAFHAAGAGSDSSRIWSDD